MDVAARKKRAEKALAKQAAGKSKLSRDELRDIDWLEDRQRQEIVRDALAALPKGLYCQLAGRQQKVIDEQGRRHQLPVLGPTVDLFDAVRKLHDILTEHGDRIAGDDSIQSELNRETLAHQRTKRRLLELEYEQKQDTIVGRDELAAIMAWWKHRLLAFGELLGRKHGADAQKDLNDLLRKAEAELENSDRTIKGVSK